MKNEPILRIMRLDDAEEVHAIEAQVAINPWSAKLFYDCVNVGYNCWVYELDASIIGYGLLTSAAQEAHILNVGILPNWQGHGLGERIVRHLIVQAKKNEAEVIYLEVSRVNEIAQALYRKLNFVEVGIRIDYYVTDSGREDALILALSLI